MTEKNVPKATLQRYPVYLKALRKLKSSGVERIMSKELASVVNIEPTTIRRDFSFWEIWESRDMVMMSIG